MQPVDARPSPGIGMHVCPDGQSLIPIRHANSQTISPGPASCCSWMHNRQPVNVALGSQPPDEKLPADASVRQELPGGSPLPLPPLPPQPTSTANTSALQILPPHRFPIDLDRLPFCRQEQISRRQVGDRSLGEH